MAKHDDKIKELMAKVEVQQSGLGTKPKASWLTNGIFKYKDGSYFNLNTVKSHQQLVEALAAVLERQTVLQEAASRLGVQAEPVLWDGYSTEDWTADFKKRIEVILWEERKTQLEATKKKLGTLVSEEARTGMELENIEKLLGK